MSEAIFTREVSKTLREAGTQEMITKQISEGDNAEHEEGIFWMIWFDVVIPIAKKISSCLKRIFFPLK